MCKKIFKKDTTELEDGLHRLKIKFLNKNGVGSRKITTETSTSGLVNVVVTLSRQITADNKAVYHHICNKQLHAY